jgi:hypothetical protein
MGLVPCSYAISSSALRCQLRVLMSRDLSYVRHPMYTAFWLRAIATSAAFAKLGGGIRCDDQVIACCFSVACRTRSS